MTSILYPLVHVAFSVVDMVFHAGRVMTTQSAWWGPTVTWWTSGWKLSTAHAVSRTEKVSDTSPELYTSVRTSACATSLDTCDSVRIPWDLHPNNHVIIHDDMAAGGGVEACYLVSGIRMGGGGGIHKRLGFTSGYTVNKQLCNNNFLSFFRSLAPPAPPPPRTSLPPSPFL